MHAIINREDTRLYIDAVRITDIDHTHVTLRQLDSRQQSGNKYIILDMSTETALQSVLKQVIRNQS